MSNKLYRIKNHKKVNSSIFDNLIDHYGFKNRDQVDAVLWCHYNAVLKIDHSQDEYLEFQSAEECVAFILKWS